MRKRLASTVALWVLGAAVVRVAAVPAERCPDHTPVQLRAGIDAAIGWLTANQDPDGRWLYEYERRTDRRLPGYNEVRHAGVAMSLYQAAAWGRPEALAPADQGLAYMEANLVRRDSWAAFVPGGRDAKLGASALLVAALAYRRQATEQRRYDALLAEVGRFLVAQQQPDGSFLAFWSPRTGAPVPGRTSLYATGEAYFALTLLDTLFPGGGWRGPGQRAARYVATERDDREYGWWGPWADQWAAYALEQTPWPLSEAELEYARRLSWRFGFLTRGEAQRRHDGPQRLVRRHPARGGGFGTVVEGTASLYVLAATLPGDGLGDVRADLRARQRCAVGIALDRQTTPADAADEPNPSRVAGAWFHQGRTRMDDQQHVLSGLVREEWMATRWDGPVHEGADPGRGVWDAVLLVLGMVLVLNPARALLRLETRVLGASAGARRRTAAAGAVLSFVLAAVAAVSAGPLLDALDVSASMFRIPAGVVIALSGLAAAVLPVRQWGPWGAEPSRADVLAPLTVPVLVHPALLAGALAWGADRGVAPTLAGVAAAGAVFVAAAGRLPRLGRPLVGGVAARAAGLATIAVGVVYGLHGVLGV